MKHVLAASLFLLVPIAHGDAPASAANDCQTPQPPTNGSETIVCSVPRPNTVVWRIDRPNVKQKQTVYPAIRFAAGDLVSVFAGGCVQTGGLGLTWKRYVNPTSRLQGTDNQYHGLISLPGFGALRHIRDAVLAGGIGMVESAALTQPLSLGYVDNGYSDNGYYRHDDGLWQQCNDMSDAWVVIAIQHGCATSPSAACVRGRALDLVADARDVNGFPTNPDWVFRRITGTAPKASDVCGWSKKIGGFPVDKATLCISTATAKDSKWYCVQGGTAGGLAGHMNLVDMPVTYDGLFWWESHDYYWDDDYTFNTASLDASGTSSGALFLADQANPQVEFDSDETIDAFANAPWWGRFHEAVDNEDEHLHTANAVPAGLPQPSDLLPRGTEAIVIGQLGLDCAHSCNTELHPAWAVFIHVKADLDDDTWAFFVRNWGDEGYCSSDDHQPGTATRFTVRLPRRGASNVAVRPDTTAVWSTQQNVPYSVIFAGNGGSALATFALPPAKQRGLVFGELHLRWTPAFDNALYNNLVNLATAAGIGDTELRRSVGGSAPSAQAVPQIEAMIRRAVFDRTAVGRRAATTGAPEIGPENVQDEQIKKMPTAFAATVRQSILFRHQSKPRLYRSLLTNLAPASNSGATIRITSTPRPTTPNDAVREAIIKQLPTPPPS